MDFPFLSFLFFSFYFVDIVNTLPTNAEAANFTLPFIREGYYCSLIVVIP